MSQHLSQTQLTAYNERTLYPDELLSVDSHLAACDECHERLVRMAPTVAKFSGFESGEEPFHLDYEQHLEPYVDGTASDIEHEIVESHVALCRECATELRDLLAFRQQPVAVPAGGAGVSSRWKQWLPQWFLLPNSAFATAAVIGVFASIAAVVIWATYPAFRRVEQADTVVPAPGHLRSPETSQPSPSPTEHAAQGNSPSNEAPHNEPTVSAPAPEQPMIAVYDGNGQLILTQRGRLEGVEDLPRDLRESVEQALVTRQLPASPGLAGFYSDAANLRGDSDVQAEFVPLAPANVVVETVRPAFRWRALDAAQDYTVSIYDANSRLVATSGPVTGTEWTTPTPLERGVTYSWQISALKDGERIVSPKPPLPEARFRILDQRTVVALTKLKKSVGSSHLVMGVFYWKHGLIEDSEREFEALALANPNSAVVEGLLASIRSIRGP